MNRDRIINIGKPYIEYVDSDVHGKAVRLCANITKEDSIKSIHEEKILYYEFEEKYAPYLCSERSDAFLIGLLTMGMEENYNIEFEAPISERLYYQLTTYYIPIVSDNNKSMLNYIKLMGPLINIPIPNLGKVATGCSGGVDSFYTIVRHNKTNTIKNYQLTHLIFASCGTLTSNNEQIKRYYKGHFKEIEKIAKQEHCELIGCYTNLHEFYKFPYSGFCTFFSTIYGSVVYAIQKLIGIYYQSSGDPIKEFTINLDKTPGYDGSAFDILTLSCMCTENLTFYSSGTEFSRIEKENFIAQSESAQRYLAVCGRENAGAEQGKYLNCSICPKCLRTMVHLYALKKLDNFKDVFDINDFYKHKHRRIGKMMATNKKSYVNDAIKIAKYNHVKIGFQSYLWKWFIYKPYIILAKKLNKVLWIRKIYYKFNLDYKIQGYRDAKFEAYKDKL